ncbi:MAG: AmmeMemoRadiSam system protein B [Anaerolineae bacterium]|nr:AmmeMemoRadiSam system protein B [Anaerolineae bacterium]
MPVRQPAVAGRFYPARRADCVRDIESYLPTVPPADLPARIVAGVVPHAGWAFSGATAARVFAAIRSQFVPDTVVLLSAMHSWGAMRPAVYADGAWATPLGQAPIDAALARLVLDEGRGRLVDAPEAHANEHSAEVQVPFIQYLFPDARILPVLVPPDAQAVAAGKVIGRAIETSGKAAVVVGTTDLTHYGAQFYGFAPAGIGDSALEWARENDRRIIDLMLQMDAEEVVDEAHVHHNACGGGAIAAAISAAQVLGADQSALLDYTTSHHVQPHGPAANFVGYAAVVWGHS